MNAKTLGERMRELRLERNLSLRQLAVRIDKSAPFISDIELGRRFPSPEVLTHIAQALEVDEGDLERFDFRESVSALKQLAQTDAEWSMALRTTAEQIEKGRLTAEDLLQKLSVSDQEAQGD